MYTPFTFRPKLFDTFRAYTWKMFSTDVSAGVTVGIIALPMAMAFAIGSGAKPEAGLITAIIAGFLTSFFGGTRVAIGGPTGAFVAIVAGIVATYGFSGLLICTMMAGAILFFMGLVRLGGLIRYIPAPLIKGFTTGIAVTILCGQLRDFLGIQVSIDTSNALATFSGLLPLLGEAHLSTTLVGIVSLLLIFLWPRRLDRYVPGSIAAMLLVTGVCLLAANAWGFGVETIDSRYGGIPRSLPWPALPEFDLDTFQRLLSPALTIALLGAIESLLCATAADSMIEDEHNPDQELMAQGIANFVTPMFGGLPATGAIARTAANIRSGARTPVSGLVHSLVLLCIMLVAAPLAKYIPLAVLSAVLIVVAVHMGDWNEFLYLPRYPRQDAFIFLLTFSLTVLFGLTQAVFVGMVVACLLFIRGISMLSSVGVYLAHHHDEARKVLMEQKKKADQPYLAEAEANNDVMLVSMSGAMFFGAARKMRKIIQMMRETHKVIILRMGQVISLDATALFALEDIIKKTEQRGLHLILEDVHEAPMRVLRRSRLLRNTPQENIVADLEQAMARADYLMESGASGRDVSSGPNTALSRPQKSRAFFSDLFRGKKSPR